MGAPHLYLHEVDRFQEAWLCSQHTGIDDPSSGRDDLATSSMNGVCVECDVMDVESNRTDILLTQDTLKEEGEGRVSVYPSNWRNTPIPTQHKCNHAHNHTH